MQNNQYDLYKDNENDHIWWVDNAMDCKGEYIFTFDKIHFFNLFQDYPHALSKEQKEIFDKENPFWRDYFQDRQL